MATGNGTTFVMLTGELVLSTGKAVSVHIELGAPEGLSREETRELENARIALHDLTPRGRTTKG